MRRKALKARFGREANFSEREAMIPRKLARANHETSLYRDKREVMTCVKSKEKPACDFSREAIAEPREKCETSKICTNCKISDTCKKRKYKNSLKSACDFLREVDTEPSMKHEASNTCEKHKTSYTRERRDDKNSLQPACDSPREVNTELSNKARPVILERNARFSVRMAKAVGISLSIVRIALGVRYDLR